MEPQADKPKTSTPAQKERKKAWFKKYGFVIFVSPVRTTRPKPPFRARISYYTCVSDKSLSIKAEMWFQPLFLVLC